MCLHLYMHASQRAFACVYIASMQTSVHWHYTCRQSISFPTNFSSMFKCKCIFLHFDNKNCTLSCRYLMQLLLQLVKAWQQPAILIFHRCVRALYELQVCMYLCHDILINIVQFFIIVMVYIFLVHYYNYGFHSSLKSIISGTCWHFNQSVEHDLLKLHIS